VSLSQGYAPIFPSQAAVAAKRGTTENFFWTGESRNLPTFEEA
jgi:hypothetical protein